MKGKGRNAGKRGKGEGKRRRREFEEGRERGENRFRHGPIQKNTYIHECKYVVVYPHTEICNKV